MDGHICWTKWTIHTLCLPFYQSCYEHHIPMFYPHKDLCDEETVVGNRIIVSQVFPLCPLTPITSILEMFCVMCLALLYVEVCWRVGLSMLDTQGLGSPSFL